MLPKELSESLLLKQFQDFYQQIVLEKKRLQNLEPGAEESGGNGSGQRIRTKLYNLLERQAREAGLMGGGYGAGYYREAQYAMAALADEIFLNLDWEGRKAWQAHLLESKIFGTNSAGDVLFRKMVSLLKEKNQALIELAAVYFWTLSLGFQGKFRGKNDSGRLEQLRLGLFTYIHRHPPALTAETGPLIPETYDHTLSAGPGKRLSYIWRWLGIILALILLYLLASHVLWHFWTYDLNEVTQKILSLPQSP